ncbi:MAG: hypothetical protein HPY45_17795 [Anaerolineae bacterium]|nr:hypothetical protein [Anaerolineae bacterium]
MENMLPPKKDHAGFAIASLVVGILSLCPGVFLACLGWPLALVAIVLGILGLKSSRRTLAIVGIVLAVLAILAGCVYFIYADLGGEELRGLLKTFGGLMETLRHLLQTIIGR